MEEVTLAPDLAPRRMVTTQAGRELLDVSPRMRMLLAISCMTIDPNHSLQSTGKYEHIGAGEYTEVWGTQDKTLALKVSTPRAGTYGHIGTHEQRDLIAQLIFTSWLKRDLADNAIDTITTPNQYFAVQTKLGNYILVQERMNRLVVIACLYQTSSYDTGPG